MKYDNFSQIERREASSFIRTKELKKKNQKSQSWRNGVSGKKKVAKRATLFITVLTSNSRCYYYTTP